MKFKKNDLMTMIIINKERIFYKKKYICLLLIRLNNNINILYSNTLCTKYIQLYICIILYIPIQITDDMIIKC